MYDTGSFSIGTGFNRASIGLYVLCTSCRFAMPSDRINRIELVSKPVNAR